MSTALLRRIERLENAAPSHEAEWAWIQATANEYRVKNGGADQAPKPMPKGWKPDPRPFDVIAREARERLGI